MNFTLQTPFISKLSNKIFTDIEVDVLRTDIIHEIVSGNKWYKLKHHITEAKKQQKNTIITFGGAYSNHIVATAFACKVVGLQSIGIIRGEKPENLSHTLVAAKMYGMQLHFVSRTIYADKESLKKYYNNDCYWINEGGYGTLGMLGAAEILHDVDTSKYTHIFCSCGTGTMLAGLLLAAKPHQQIMGVSALKSHTGLEQDIINLLPIEKKIQPNILHNYHFGGYAKHPKSLIDFMNTFWEAEKIPTDIVYTSKLFYAVIDVWKKNFFAKNDKPLIIHCGGLQGNLSLPTGTLVF